MELNCQLYTWTSPNDQCQNQIDYTICSQRWRSCIQSAKTRPGADCGSDHQLLTAKLRLLNKVWSNISTSIQLARIFSFFTLFGTWPIIFHWNISEWKSLSRVWLFATPWNSPGQNTAVGNLSLLQGIFPTQGLNPGLPHYRQIIYQLSHNSR